MGEGSDVAKAVRAIAEGMLDYSTGQILNVDEAELQPALPLANHP